MKMIRHIFTQVWNQRRSNSWIFIELMLVSIFLWYIVDFLYASTITYTAPLGYDIDHVYRINLSDKTDKSIGFISPDVKTTTDGEDYLTIIDRIRNYPGVEAVGISDFGAPYIMESRNWVMAIDSFNVYAQHAIATADFFRVFKVKDENGEYETLAKSMESPLRAIISQDVVKEIDSKESLLNKTSGFNRGSNQNRIVIAGVSTSLRRYEYVKPNNFYYYSIVESEIAKVIPTYFLHWELCIRVDPDMDKDFATRFEKDMFTQLSVGNLYFREIQSYSNIREAYIQSSGDRNEVKSQVSIALFLLANIFLGIIGTFWFRTEYRKGEMGLRMALGSSRKQLSSILVSEGVLLLTIAFIPALIVNANVAYLQLINVEQMDSTVVRFLITTGITYLLMISMIIAGIWYPARQTTRLEPAEALHYE